MTTKLASAIAAGALTVGILVGAAATVLVHDATGTPMGMTEMGAMHEMMGGQPGSMMDGAMMDGAMGPSASIGPAQHRAHHPGSDR